MGAAPRGEGCDPLPKAKLTPEQRAWLRSLADDDDDDAPGPATGDTPPAPEPPAAPDPVAPIAAPAAIVAEGHADVARIIAQGDADSARIDAQADADARTATAIDPQPGSGTGAPVGHDGGASGGPAAAGDVAPSSSHWYQRPLWGHS